ncbi:hypothetical protein QJS04_geneDACA007255 [Acorus gramineus]|uniref:Myb/SANT-like domain-containing protein n=1 Tax=Acorus gramineus TaxID=55184 RepID=A0AAV9BPX1_ACOGR|nr:hypothetical protein QJS04_geneDACA007255 [Acorus gramineus]
MSSPYGIFQDGDRANWTTQRDQFVIEMLIEHGIYAKNSNPGYVKEAWRSICLAFNQKYNLRYTVSQIKTRHRLLKKQYKMVKLLREQSGFGWDDTMKVVTADEDLWELFIRENPDARNYKNKCFPLHELSTKLFEGGKTEGRPTLSSLRPDAQEDVSTSVNTKSQRPFHTVMNDKFHDNDDDASFEDAVPLDSFQPPKQSIGTTSYGRKRKARLMKQSRTAAALKRAMSSRLSSISRPVETAKPSDEFSYRQCIEVLQTLKDLDVDECVDAVTILKKKTNRIAFMTLKGELRLRWLRKELGKL